MIIPSTVFHWRGSSGVVCMVSAFARWDEFLNCDGCAECLLDHFECRKCLQFIQFLELHWFGLLRHNGRGFRPS